MVIGERIRERREAKNLTQGQLAEIIDGDGNAVSRWERNKIGIGSAYIIKLAKALDTSTDYLLGKTNDPTLSSSESVQEVKNEKQADPPAEKHVTVDEKRGKLSYTFGNGEKLELPDTEKGYALFEKILMQKIGLDLGKVAPAV